MVASGPARQPSKTIKRCSPAQQVLSPHCACRTLHIPVLPSVGLRKVFDGTVKHPSYQTTCVLAPPQAAVQALEAREKICGATQEKPDAIYIGVPPLYHGSMNDPKADMELQLSRVCWTPVNAITAVTSYGAHLIFHGLLQAGLNLFVEKPLSLKPAAEVAELAGKLSELQSQQGLVIAVGYMLRAAPAVQVLSVKSRN